MATATWLGEGAKAKVRSEDRSQGTKLTLSEGLKIEESESVENSSPPLEKDQTIFEEVCLSRRHIIDIFSVFQTKRCENRKYKYLRRLTGPRIL